MSEVILDKQLTLVAVGNRTMGDDGIAPLIVEALQDNLPTAIEVQIWDNTDALSVAAELLNIDNTLVLVDCADMAIATGEYRWFRRSECILEKHLNSLSTHGFGFADALALAEKLGFEQDFYFFAIQPETIEVNDKLSDCLRKNISRLTRALEVQLEKLINQSI